jgi:DNA-binding NarL/FixJ family response regulator
MLAAIRRALERDGGIEVVGEARSGEALLELVERLPVDAVLLDLRMPGLDGLSTLSALRAQRPGVAAVVLSAYEEAEDVREALARGAVGYLVKTINPLHLGPAVRRLVAGGDEGIEALESQRREGFVPRHERHRLTARELQILRLLADGRSNTQIARRLRLSPHTIKFHLSNVYRKLGVTNRTEAASMAHRGGFT